MSAYLLSRWNYVIATVQKPGSPDDGLFFADGYIGKTSVLFCCFYLFPNNSENFAASKISEGFSVCNFFFIDGQK